MFSFNKFLLFLFVCLFVCFVTVHIFPSSIEVVSFSLLSHVVECVSHVVDSTYSTTVTRVLFDVAWACCVTIVFCAQLPTVVAATSPQLVFGFVSLTD